MRQKIRDQKRKPNIQSDQEVQQISQRICKRVSQALVEHIFVHMQDWMQRAKKKEVMSENIVEIVGKQLVESADVEDRKFLLEFVKS